MIQYAELGLEGIVRNKNQYIGEESQRDIPGCDIHYIKNMQQPPQRRVEN